MLSQEEERVIVDGQRNILWKDRWQQICALPPWGQMELSSRPSYVVGSELSCENSKQEVLEKLSHG